MSEERGGALSPTVLAYLRCPRCRAEMRDLGDEGVTCANEHHYGRTNGYLDFSQEAKVGGTTQATFASFGYEWNAFDQVRDEDEAFAEIYFRDLDLEGLRGKVGLDAGCGKGRFTRILARYLDHEVALDGSIAAEAAARNLSDCANITVMRSDLRTAPFAPESFDFISSLGVLHHLDDPQEGFRQLHGLLAPGGQMLLYLYSRPSERNVRAVAQQLATVTRVATVRLPHKTLKTLSTPIAGVLYGTMVAPGRWGASHNVPALANLPMDTYRDKPFRSLVLDTFDRLSAPVEYRYVWEDLQPWFDEVGMTVDAARDETGWFVVAHKPLAD